MPVINQLPKKQKNNNRNETEHRKVRQEAYQSTAWRKLRLAYLKEHPCCEECLKTNRVRAASSVHHIQSPFRGNGVDYSLLLNPSNLESVCHECHGNLHAKEQGHISAEDTIKLLDALFEGKFGNDDNKSGD